MTWRIGDDEFWNPTKVYDLAKRHRLEPDLPPEDSVRYFQTVSAASVFYRVFSGEEVVATIAVSGLIRGYKCDLDLVPIPRHFDHGFEEDFRAAVAPLLTALFEDHLIHRVSAFVPESRSKTKSALKALGFIQEGRARDAVRFKPNGYGTAEPEDLILMGLLAPDWMARKSDAVNEELHEPV